MPTSPIPLRLPDHLLQVAELRARLERVDRASALRALLYAAATDYVLALLGEGRISLSKAASLLDCSALEIQRMAQEHGLTFGSDGEDYRAARQSVAQLGTRTSDAASVSHP